MKPEAIEIRGLKELIERIEALPDQPLRDFWQRCGVIVTGKQKRLAPVDRGRMRAAITHQIDTNKPPVWLKVGVSGGSLTSQQRTAAMAMEYGTGKFAEGPNAKGGRHWPPGDALEIWAKRHGLPNGFVVARAIGKRGGLKPRRFLRQGLKDSLAAIRRQVQRLGADIVAAWAGE